MSLVRCSHSRATIPASAAGMVNNKHNAVLVETTMTTLPPPGSPDIDIARAVKPWPIFEVAQRKLGIAHHALIPYGHYKAKLDLAQIETKTKLGKLVLVTAITPTPAGEGKTTTSIGLTDALNAIGINASVCLREPSLGPCFGVKGGAAGGGRAQAIPMEDLNLHFNGDFHAITSAHNLLAALIDNHIHWGNELNLDPRRITWRRVMDMNDRALRNTLVGLGGPAHGQPRESGFDITVASEIMAILCLAEDRKDLQKRLGNIIIGRNRDNQPVTARELGAEGAMTVLLKEAIQPNLIQTLEHNPALIHGGPFANIAHGCNSVMATRTAMALSDVVVTEAGFGADLGAEKFIDIKCRMSGLMPDAVVLVCTVRALKMQGGVPKADLDAINVEAVIEGSSNLSRHIKNLQQFGLTPLVAINRFPTDDDKELAAIKEVCLSLGAPIEEAQHWAEGGLGAKAVAEGVKAMLDGEKPDVKFLYDNALPIDDKIRTVATKLYGASDVQFNIAAQKQLDEIQALGFGDLPICIAKTPYSFSADPTLLGAPSDHVLPVRELRLMAGAGFVVAICGDVMTMPGLPRKPAALSISLDENGEIVGLF
ncbi:formate--tetrahydrofolate ligase [Enterovibrio norvegicus]|uniref:Formate--tetrahydrofolate ligase n=1 Tax=Enterovibrio norvegicus TaxID=188144 RepID=A0ABV4L3L3_9GAMM|nr:formate--tetrahydrofolate ligase [Enterovibrio norvegicus]OEF56502.1 formate--tetrahydrofolate ligase [Enterovibrio norvegicus]